MKQLSNGFDVDPDAFAETLHDIADAFVDREASIKEADENHAVRVDEASEHELRFTFVAERGREDLFDAIEYTDPEEDNE